MCLRNFTNVRFLSGAQALIFKLVTLFPFVVRPLIWIRMRMKRHSQMNINEFLWQTTKVYLRDFFQ